MRMLLRAALLIAFSLLASWPIQAADSGAQKTFYGIWKGEWHVSGAQFRSYDAKIVFCIGPLYTSKGSKQIYGWANRSSDSFGYAREARIFIDELRSENGTMVVTSETNKGTQHFTFVLAGKDKLTGSSDFESDRFEGLVAQGSLILTKVEPLKGGRHCPPANKWPAS